MIRRPPRSTHCISSAASDVYKRQPSSPSPQTNCDICPNGAMGIELQNIIDGNTTCEQAYDIVGCVNVIDFLPLSGVHFGEGADTYDDSLHIIFNTDYNITGFQFELDGLDITSINPQSNANFTITHSSTTMAVSYTHLTLPTICSV